MTTLKNMSYGFLGLLISIVLLLTSVEVVTFDLNHYIREYEKHEIVAVTEIDMEDLKYITDELLSYLRDDRDDLVIEGTVRGETREIFGQREKQHMVDVKKLFIEGRRIRNVGFIIVVSILLWISKNKEGRRKLAKTFLYTVIVNISLIIILFLLMYFDFNRYFNYFHYIFFNNDLWLLDPNTDIMIQMLPQDFFYNTAIKIVKIYVTSIGILGIIGFWYHKKTV